MRKTLQISTLPGGVFSIQTHVGPPPPPDQNGIHIEYPSHTDTATLAEVFLRAAAAAGIKPSEFRAALQRAAGVQGGK